MFHQQKRKKIKHEQTDVATCKQMANRPKMQIKNHIFRLINLHNLVHDCSFDLVTIPPSIS